MAYVTAEQIRERLLKRLNGKPESPSELMQELERDPNWTVSEAEVNNVIWSMISESSVELTSDWRIKKLSSAKL